MLINPGSGLMQHYLSAEIHGIGRPFWQFFDFSSRGMKMAASNCKDVLRSCLEEDIFLLFVRFVRLLSAVFSLCPSRL